MFAYQAKASSHYLKLYMHALQALEGIYEIEKCLKMTKFGWAKWTFVGVTDAFSSL